MSQSIDIGGFRLVSGGVLVCWQWEWINDRQLGEDDGDDASHTSITVIPETSDEEEEDEDVEEDSQAGDLNISPLQAVITHSIVFKCIGCTKENHYQETLCRAAQCMANMKTFLV